MKQSEVEKQILEPSLYKIVISLKKLYVDKTSMFVTQNAKDRIKNDISVLLQRFCDPMKPHKMSREFLEAHFYP